MTEIAQRSLMPAAADELFAWQARPGAFERLLPPWEQVELRRVARSLSGGEQAEFVIPIGPLRQRWVADHDALADVIGFRDHQIVGPFERRERTHRITTTENSDEASWLEDHIQYDVPQEAFERFLLGRSMRKSLNRTFAYRHRVTTANLVAHHAA